MQVFLLKRNLRLQDSDPFYEAMRGYRRFGPVLPLYIHEPSIIRQPDICLQHQNFIFETLDELSQEIRSIGGKLLELVGEAVPTLDVIHQIAPIARICTHQETTQGVQYERDKAVRKWCSRNSVKLVEFQQDGVVRAGCRDQKKQTFPEYFADSVNRELKDPGGIDLGVRFASTPLPSAPRVTIPRAQGYDRPFRQPGGRSEAEKLFKDFFSVGSINSYPFKLSSPNTAWEGCSRISAYLSYGIVSDRAVMKAIDDVVSSGHSYMDAAAFEKLQGRARFYLDRLMWRRNYLQMFEDDPTLEHRHALSQFDGVRISDREDPLFKAWQSGRTGFPFIDACVRCLKETGWLNMRGRAAITSFATMNLWHDSLNVAAFLAGEFLDYMPGIHWPIIQVVSGTASPQNGIMVYCPMKQALDHDKDGVFIRKYVPELSDLQAPHIHDLSRTTNHLSDLARRSGFLPYPAPIVDHIATARVAKKRVSYLQKGKVEVLSQDHESSSTSSVQLGLL